jgi:predicted DNA-binding transcriptional regulator AlpA
LVGHASYLNVVAESLALSVLVWACTGTTERIMDVQSQRLLRPPEASDYVGLSTSTLAKMRITGGGPKFVRLSPRAIGYFEADLVEWLMEKRCASTSEYEAKPAKNAPG